MDAPPASTFQQFMQFCDHWGNASSIVGFVITILGFPFALLGIVSAKRAAKQAEVAARLTKESILRSETITNFAKAIEIMEFIKSRNRADAWIESMDRVAQLRRILVELRANSPQLSENQTLIIGGMSAQFADIEKKLERRQNGKTEPSVARINQIVSLQIDALHEISISIKHK
jgi:hypothetical protein